MPGKRVSAADMLGTQRKTDQETGSPEAAVPEHPNVPTSSALVTLAPQYERITVYLRPGQRAWLEDVLDKKVRDASGRPIKSISASDIIRLAIELLQDSVDNRHFPLLEELIAAANR